MKTATINGREMTAPEISRWVSENRDYRLSTRTIYERMLHGLTDEDLVAPPKRAGDRKHSEKTSPWPQPLTRVAIPGWGCRV